MNLMDAVIRITADNSDATKKFDETEQKAGGLKGALSKAGELGAKAVKGATVAVAAVGTASIAAGKKIWDMSNQVSQAGDTIDKQSQKVGLSYEAYQKWDYAMTLAGTSMAACSVGMKTLTNTFDSAQDGSAGAISKFERLGLTMDDLKGKSREEIFETTVEALQNMEDKTEMAAAANDLFGKSGQELIPLFNQSAEATRGALEEAEKYGMVMSDDAVAASAGFQDSLTKMNGTITGVKNKVIGELLPGITQIMDGFSDLVAGNENAGESIKKGVEDTIGSITETIPKALEIISTIAEAVLDSAPAIITALADGIIGSLDTLGPVAIEVILKLADALMKMLPDIADAGIKLLLGLVDGITKFLSKPDLPKTVAEVVTKIVTVLIDNLPAVLEAAKQLFGTILTALAMLIVELVKKLPEIGRHILDSIQKIIEPLKQKWENIKKIFTDAVRSIKDTAREKWDEFTRFISGKWENIRTSAHDTWEKVKTAILSPIETARDNIRRIIDTIKGFFTGLILKFPDIKLPHFSISPSGWKISDLLEGSIPHLSIDWYKKAYETAYEFNRPTIMPTADGLKGFGDGAGSEIVIGKNKLVETISFAQTQGMSPVEEKLDLLLDVIRSYMPQILDNMGQDIVLDSNVLVGQTISKIDSNLGRRSARYERGALA